MPAQLGVMREVTAAADAREPVADVGSHVCVQVGQLVECSSAHAAAVTVCCR